MSVYEYANYKDFLREHIDRARRPGLMTELAGQAGCDRTYLSQVLSGKAQLTMDQAMNLAGAFSFSDDETDFFLLLVMKDRAVNPGARDRFERRLEKARQQNLQIAKKLRSKENPAELPLETKVRYYADWRFAAGHILSSIPATQRTSALSRALGLTEDETVTLMNELAAMRLVTARGDSYVHAGGNLHVPADSPLIALNHLNWRMKALEHVRRPGGLHYTDVFSVSAEDVPALTAQLLDFIEKQRKKIAASGAEEAHVFCCDLFPIWSGRTKERS